MIRNIVLCRFTEGAAREAIDHAVRELRSLRVPGVDLALSVDLDLGLREGNADLVLVADLPDERAYRAYDEDPGHGRIRREVLGPLCSSIERIQIRVPDPTGVGR